MQNREYEVSLRIFHIFTSFYNIKKKKKILALKVPLQLESRNFKREEIEFSIDSAITMQVGDFRSGEGSRLL